MLLGSGSAHPAGEAEPSVCQGNSSPAQDLGLKTAITFTEVSGAGSFFGATGDEGA